MPINPFIKQRLHRHCETFVARRIDGIQHAIASAQAAANDETKSSAGDKYETGRAMMQLEIEQLSAQLREALKIKNALSQVSTTNSLIAVQLGSLVTTTAGNYYISISAGRVDIEGATYFTIAPNSPIGLLLLGKRPGEECIFNKKVITVQEVC
jgi:transcription elongation GreA/GreB family factor